MKLKNEMTNDTIQELEHYFTELGALSYESVMLPKKEFGSMVKFRPHGGEWKHKTSKVASTQHRNVVFKVLDGAINYQPSITQGDSTGVGNARFVPMLGNDVLLYSITDERRPRPREYHVDLLGLAMLEQTELNVKERTDDTRDSLTRLFSHPGYTITGKYNFRELRDNAPKLNIKRFIDEVEKTGDDLEGYSFVDRKNVRNELHKWIREHSDVTESYVFCIHLTYDALKLVKRNTDSKMADETSDRMVASAGQYQGKAAYPYLTFERRLIALGQKWLKRRLSYLSPSQTSWALHDISRTTEKPITVSGYGDGSMEYGDMYYIKTKLENYAITQVLMNANSPKTGELEAITHALADTGGGYVEKQTQRRDFRWSRAGTIRTLPHRQMAEESQGDSEWRSITPEIVHILRTDRSVMISLGYRRLGDSIGMQNADAVTLYDCLERDANHGRIFFDLPDTVTVHSPHSYDSGVMDSAFKSDTRYESGRYELAVLYSAPSLQTFYADTRLHVENMIDHLKFHKIRHEASRLSWADVDYSVADSRSFGTRPSVRVVENDIIENSNESTAGRNLVTSIRQRFEEEE